MRFIVGHQAGIIERLRAPPRFHMKHGLVLVLCHSGYVLSHDFHKDFLGQYLITAQRLNELVDFFLSQDVLCLVFRLEILLILLARGGRLRLLFLLDKSAKLLFNLQLFGQLLCEHLLKISVCFPCVIAEDGPLEVVHEFLHFVGAHVTHENFVQLFKEIVYFG